MSSLASMVPVLKRGIIERLSDSADTRVAAIAKILFGTPELTSGQMKEAERLSQRDRLYNSIDGRGLSEAPQSPQSTTEWTSERS